MGCSVMLSLHVGRFGRGDWFVMMRQYYIVKRGMAVSVVHVHAYTGCSCCEATRSVLWDDYRIGISGDPDP